MNINKEEFIDLERSKQLANFGKVKSDYCWLFNDISKEWDVVPKEHLDEYPNPQKLEYYFTLKISE